LISRFIKKDTWPSKVPTKKFLEKKLGPARFRRRNLKKKHLAQQGSDEEIKKNSWPSKVPTKKLKKKHLAQQGYDEEI
jgi:hypothetical protein